MAATELTSKGTINKAGLELPALDAANADGNFFYNDGNTIIKITNGAGAAQTVTIASQVACNQGSTHNIIKAIPAGETWWFTGFKKDRFNDTAGKVNLTYDAVVSLTIGLFKLGGY